MPLPVPEGLLPCVTDTDVSPSHRVLTPDHRHYPAHGGSQMRAVVFDMAGHLVLTERAEPVCGPKKVNP